MKNNTNINSFSQQMNRTVDQQANQLAMLRAVQESMVSNDAYVTFDYKDADGNTLQYQIPSYDSVIRRLQAVEESSGEQSTEREKQLFNQFLGMLQHEQQKRQQVSYYAEHLSITPKYLSTLCRNVSGKSPMKWITDSVMEDCYQLLRDTDITVKEISNRLGFPNSSFFGQYFREQAGMTPIEYRTKYRGNF